MFSVFLGACLNSDLNIVIMKTQGNKHGTYNPVNIMSLLWEGRQLLSENRVEAWAVT